MHSKLSKEEKLLDLLNPIFMPLPASPLLIYPGSGDDWVTPMQYVKRLFPNLKALRLILIDIDDVGELIEKTLREKQIIFTKNKELLHFNWQGIEVMLTFWLKNIFFCIREIPLFDIYFEKAFRIMKLQEDEYEEIIFAKLKRGGLLISDSGFSHFSLKIIPSPKELSVYQEMIIGIKK